MMNSRILAMLKDISIDELHNYLINENWTYTPEFPNKKVNVYTKCEDSLVIPNDNRFKDYHSKLLSVLENISIINNVSLDDLVINIKSKNTDLIRFRIISEETINGKINLSYASEITTAIKELIIATACNEESPRKLFRRATKEAQKYANLFKFAQTSVGSFVINVECELPPKTCNQLMVDDNSSIIEEVEIPFERKILNRLSAGFSQINSFSNIKEIDEFVDSAYVEGINANMCQALLDMQANEDLNIETSIVFCSNQTVECDQTTQLTLDKRSFEVVKILNDHLRNSEEIENISVIAKVSKVEHANIEHVDFGGYATLTFEYGDSPKIKHAKTYLENAYYKVACDALKDQQDIMVIGLLNKSNRSWFLDDVTDFKLV